jgi:hypothetical protein
MYLDDDQITDCLRGRRFLHGSVGLNEACTHVPRQLQAPPSQPQQPQPPQVSPPPPLDIYHEIEARNEGIDQEEIIFNLDYTSVLNVLDNPERDRMMNMLQTPEQPILLTVDVLAKQFEDNQGKYFSKEMADHWKETIIGRKK